MDSNDTNIRAAKRLRARLEALDYTPREYSGRGMGGKSCLGVTVDHVGDLLAELPKTAVRSAVQDAMGRGAIVYWPHLPWIATPEPEPRPQPAVAKCEDCEEAPALVRVAASKLDGTLLDSADVCVGCATKRCFVVGKL